MDDVARKRNLYRSNCCYCWKTVKVGQGYAERGVNGWRVIHVEPCDAQRSAGIPYQPKTRKPK